MAGRISGYSEMIHRLLIGANTKKKFQVLKLNPGRERERERVSLKFQAIFYPSGSFQTFYLSLKKKLCIFYYSESNKTDLLENKKVAPNLKNDLLRNQGKRWSKVLWHRISKVPGFASPPEESVLRKALIQKTQTTRKIVQKQKSMYKRKSF